MVRGYLSGSGWKDYQKSGAVCGIPLPAGLQESDSLGEPIFTPSTKAEIGTHDENINFSAAEKLVGKETAARLKQLTIAIYQKARSIAEEKGIIIADTKFEFGMLNGEIILIDEVLTPDSSRFWPRIPMRREKRRTALTSSLCVTTCSALPGTRNRLPPRFLQRSFKKPASATRKPFAGLPGKNFPLTADTDQKAGIVPATRRHMIP